MPMDCKTIASVTISVDPDTGAVAIDDSTAVKLKKRQKFNNLFYPNTRFLNNCDEPLDWVSVVTIVYRLHCFSDYSC